jgi:hypothetical protein
MTLEFEVLTQKQSSWKDYKTERRIREMQDRLNRKAAIAQLKKLMAEAAASGKVLMRQKIKPHRKYPELVGGRAAARNIEFRRPPVGNRRAHHRKA